MNHISQKHLKIGMSAYTNVEALKEIKKIGRHNVNFFALQHLAIISKWTLLIKEILKNIGR